MFMVLITAWFRAQTPTNIVEICNGSRASFIPRLSTSVCLRVIVRAISSPRLQAELEKGIKEGQNRISELHERVKMLELEGGEVEGEDPVRLDTVLVFLWFPRLCGVPWFSSTAKWRWR